MRKEEGEEDGLKVRVFSVKSRNVKGPETVANHVSITMLDVLIKKERA